MEDHCRMVPERCDRWCSGYTSRMIEGTAGRIAKSKIEITPANTRNHPADVIHAIAMQAVGSALTGGHGGLGIAKMVAKHLEAQAAHKDAAKAVSSNPNIKNDLGTPPISIKPLVTPKVTKGRLD